MTTLPPLAEQPFEANAFPLDPGIRLLEASAGTGKTFALAQLVLRYVAEAELSLRQLLVVTFTDAAAAELRDRIGQRLQCVHAGIGHQFVQQAFANRRAGNVGHDVADHAVGRTDVKADDVPHRLLALAGVKEATGRQHQPFLDYLSIGNGQAVAADVGQMADGHDKSDQIAGAEYRPGHADIGRVSGA